MSSRRLILSPHGCWACNSQSLTFCEWLARRNGTNQPETRCLSRVKTGKAQPEQMFSGLPSKSGHKPVLD